MPSPTIFSYSLEDENGTKGTVDLFVAYDAATETVASILGAAAAFGGLIDAVTGALVIEFNVKINALPDPSWKDTVVADTDIEKTLLLNFNAADTKYPEPVMVPGVLATLIDTDGKPVIASGAIKALTDAIAAGSGAVYPNNKFLLDLTSLRDAAVTFRKRKGSLKSTRRKA